MTALPRSSAAIAILIAACGKPDGRAELDALLREAGIELVLATAETAVLETTACKVTDELQCVRCELAAPGSELHPRALAEAIRAAPLSFVKAAGVKRIALCEQLAYAGEHGPAPGGTIDFARGMLLVKRPAHTDHYSAAVLQHELYHLFDAQQPTRDTAWLALNPRGFRYGQPAERGFARAYGTTNIREDKATVYERLIEGGLCDEPDPILLAKARLVRARIGEAIGADARFLDEIAPCLERGDARLPGRVPW